MDNISYLCFPGRLVIFLQFPYGYYQFIYLVVAIYKIRQPLNIWKYEASCLHLIELTIYLYKMYYYLFIYLSIYIYVQLN